MLLQNASLSKRKQQAPLNMETILERVKVETWLSLLSLLLFRLPTLEPIRFPYLLPNVLGASLALVGLLLVFFFLEESLDIPKDGDRY